MEITGNAGIETRKDENAATLVSSYNMKCFIEVPWKTGPEKPLPRIGAFELFNLFTANIIREKSVFTR